MLKEKLDFFTNSSFIQSSLALSVSPLICIGLFDDVIPRHSLFVKSGVSLPTTNFINRVRTNSFRPDAHTHNKHPRAHNKRNLQIT